MSWKAGRVGVNPREVDVNANRKSSSSGAYTKEEIDAKFETKENIGGLQFRVENANAQYKIPNGDWVNFNSGNAGLGFNIPIEATPITQEMVEPSYSSWFNVLEGSRYFIKDKILYVDVLIHATTDISSAYINITVNEQSSHSSIVETNLASETIEGTHKLDKTYIDVISATTVLIRFFNAKANETYRLYGQITLNN